MIGTFHHSGLYVEDLARTAREMSEAFGLVWTEPVEMTMTQQSAAGPLRERILVAFSVEGAPFELIEERDGRAWTGHHGGPLNHACFVVDDLAGALAAPPLSGYEREMWEEDGDGRPAGSAHLVHRGARHTIELYDQARRRQVDRWVAAERARLGLGGACVRHEH